MDPRTEMRARLKELGLRATSPRLAVLVVLNDAMEPLSHEVIMGRLGESLDRATVYRILADLCSKGLLRRMDLGDHIWRFELADRCGWQTNNHAHFLCDDCGVVTCLPELEIQPANNGVLPARLVGAQLHLRLSGRCGECVS